MIGGSAGESLPVENLEKYATLQVPRYTSYPTAPHFNAAIGAPDYAGWHKPRACTRMAAFFQLLTLHEVGYARA